MYVHAFSIEFRYTTVELLDTRPFSAPLSSYEGGGYVYPLDKASATVRADLKELQARRWTDRHTRAIFLEFAVYNPNVY